MFYYNAATPRYPYGPGLKPPTKTRKKRAKFSRHSHKKKKYYFAYYLKYVLWKKFKRYWKKRRSKTKRSKSKVISSVLGGKGSEEKIDQRDFWGSRYGSQWLFAKQRQQQQQRQVSRHHLIEIVDAFKTKDLKYANRHSRGDRSRASSCPCCREAAEGSDWSLSTARPYSQWPPHGAGQRTAEQPLSRRQHAYVYNWLRVDQLQGGRGLGRLSMSREYLDQVRKRIEGSEKRRSKRARSSGSSCCSGSSSCASSSSRRRRSKMLKRQIRAKERASILWLLSKAFGGRIPSDLKEPFYRDQDNVRRLKPKIVHSLANAELYCLALVNIYSDPNYNNLDHQGVIQALTRKGICLVESRDAPLTETTLVQTAPLKLNAHMSVIDGIMSLFIKEVLIPEKIVDVCRKFSSVDMNSEMPSNPEEAAVLWINKCCKTLEMEIHLECSPGDEHGLPQIPVLQEISDISDGCCLAAVICYYCPSYLKWQDVVWSGPISTGDCIYNLQLIRKFCNECLPSEINFFTLEDLLYLHQSLKENVLAFVSDLLYLFVITQVSCITPKKKNVAKETSQIPLENSKSLSNFPSHKSQALCSPIPNLRSDVYGGSTSSLPDIRPGSRARTYGSKERLTDKLKKSNISNDEFGSMQRTGSTGVMNGWKTNLPGVGSPDSFSGGSRHLSNGTRPAAEGESSSSNLSHPSVGADDSSLKHPFSPKSDLPLLNAPHREHQGYGFRKSSEGFLHDHHLPSGLNGELKRSRKSLEDYYSHLAGGDGPLRSISASNITESKGVKNNRYSPRSHAGGGSVPESASSQSSGICLSDADSKVNLSTTSFAQLSKIKDCSSSSINIVYMNHEREETEREKNVTSVSKKNPSEVKKTTFAALPNTTTWQQQHAAHANFPQTDSGHETPTEPMDHMLNTQLCNIKLKLEEKKRKIELKKKRMELLWKKQRQKLGKAAFLQAVTKGSATDAGTPDSGTGKEVEPELAPAPLPIATDSPSTIKKMSIQEIADDVCNMQKKWLNQTEVSEPLSLLENDLSVDVGGSIDETVNIDLQTSIEDLNTSLTNLQADISRISLQQEQVENLMKDSIDDCSHFFLHSQVSDISPFKSPSRGWQFCDSPATNFYESMDLPYQRSPHRYNNPEQQFSAFSSLPPCPDTNKSIEELYSRVVKPEQRQKIEINIKSVPSPVKSQPSRPNASSKPQTSKSKEIHIVLPQVPENKRDDQKPKADKQGFYIPIEKEETETEMQRKKEMIMNLSIQRKQEYERRRQQKEQEYARMKEEERQKQEYAERKREEEKKRREAILEQYRQRKLQEEMEKEGNLPHKDLSGKLASKQKISGPECKKSDNHLNTNFTKHTLDIKNHLASAKLKDNRKEKKPRPRSAYVSMNSDLSSLISLDNAANKRNSQIFPGRDIREFDLDSLNSGSTSASSHDRAHPRHLNLQIPEGGTSNPSSDGASDTASNGSAAGADYTGPKLFVKPTAKSNRGIIINAINTVLAGAVNQDTKKKVLEEINHSESKHFLILFRDAGCQFRALYTYNPDREEVLKLYGIGPKSVTDKMMERFYKYNSGGKCFSEIQTKHLTVTIDAFTIPNSLWAGKKMVPPKKEFL